MLAVATFVLARRTSKLAISASDSLSATIRPVLVDVPADAPGRSPVRFDDGSVDQVDAGAIHVRGTDDYLFCSVPLRNVGPGAAVITGLGLLDPPWSGKASRMVVPSGEETRFSFSIPKDGPELKEGLQRLVDGYFILEVLYTDVDGEQPDHPRVCVSTRGTALPGSSSRSASSRGRGTVRHVRPGRRVAAAGEHLLPLGGQCLLRLYHGPCRVARERRRRRTGKSRGCGSCPQPRWSSSTSRNTAMTWSRTSSSASRSDSTSTIPSSPRS